MTDLEADVRHGMLRHGFELLPLNRGLDLFKKDSFLVYVFYMRNVIDLTYQGISGYTTVPFDREGDVLAQIFTAITKYKLGVLNESRR